MIAADVSMCPDDECPSRTLCERNPASGSKPHPNRQVWTQFKHDGQGCDSARPKNAEAERILIMRGVLDPL